MKIEGLIPTSLSMQIAELMRIKVNKVNGKSLSTNDYTNSDKSNLDALALHMPVYLTVTDYDIEEPESSSGIWNYNATLIKNNPSHPFYIKETPESQHYVPCWGFATGSIGESNLTAHLYYQLEASGYVYFKYVTFTYDGIVNIVAVSRSVSASQISNWNSKQATLVSGANIKTINNASILGNGNMQIEGAYQEIDLTTFFNASAGNYPTLTVDFTNNFLLNHFYITKSVVNQYGVTYTVKERVSASVHQLGGDYVFKFVTYNEGMNEKTIVTAKRTNNQELTFFSKQTITFQTVTQ